MSARAQIAAVAEERGWSVADSGRHMSISKPDEGRYVSVTLSVRGSVTAAHIVFGSGKGGNFLGTDKATRVVCELMRDA